MGPRFPAFNCIANFNVPFEYVHDNYDKMIENANLPKYAVYKLEKSRASKSEPENNKKNKSIKIWKI